MTTDADGSDVPGDTTARGEDRTLPTAEAVSLLYDELRRLARTRLAGERAGHSLQPTGLAHETVMRMLASGRAEWGSRGHFFAVASEMMRRILVDTARRRSAVKRGGGVRRRDVSIESLAGRQPDAEVIAVGDALHVLADVDPEAAELVKLRYFGGLTMAEAAVVMGLSTRSAERLWAFARAWLARSIRGAAGGARAAD